MIWDFFLKVLNSSFASAFISALAGAAFGVWGAQRLAERSARIRELLESLREANAIVVLATTIANQALALKRQQIGPLSERFLSERERALEANSAMLAGTPQSGLHVVAELTKLSPLTLPTSELKSLIFGAQLMPGKALALISVVDQSASELANTIAMRSDLIDELRAANHPPVLLSQKYFGLKGVDGHTDSLYYDAMDALVQYNNDLAFFAAELAEVLQVHARHIRSRLLPLRPDAPLANTVDFFGPRQSGLLPPRSEYAAWLATIESEVSVPETATSKHEWKDHQRRANELGDAIRRYLVAINTGGIGVMFVLAGSMIEKHDAAWVFYPGLAFAAGLVSVGWSMVLARKREIAREYAAKNNDPPPNFPVLKMSYPYHNLSLAFFVIGVLIGLVELASLSSRLLSGAV